MPETLNKGNESLQGQLNSASTTIALEEMFKESLNSLNQFISEPLINAWFRDRIKLK
jgi:hypothetical protein